MIALYADFKDYIKFLCAIQGGKVEVMKATGASCLGTEAAAAAGYTANDLNQPSITVANLTKLRSFRRKASSVARHDETYRVSIEEPEGVSVSVSPTSFKLKRGVTCRRRQGRGACMQYTNRELTRNKEESVELVIKLTPTSASSHASFGSILLAGSRGHTARLPLSVVSRSLHVP